MYYRNILHNFLAEFQMEDLCEVLVASKGTKARTEDSVFVVP